MRRYVIFLVAVGLAIAIACTGGDETDLETAATMTVAGSDVSDQAFRPFTNIAPQLGAMAMIENRYPGVAIFDFDRDGDLDFYVTSAEVNAPLLVARGGPNRLFRNNGDGSFTEMAADAGVAAETSNSTAVVACDFNNDGYQDLYVGAQGRIGDDLDYRSVDVNPDLRDAIQDRLYLNLKDGTFRDITASAFAGGAGNPVEILPGPPSQPARKMATATQQIGRQNRIEVHIACPQIFLRMKFVHGVKSSLAKQEKTVVMSRTSRAGVMGVSVNSQEDAWTLRDWRILVQSTKRGPVRFRFSPSP